MFQKKQTNFNNSKTNPIFYEKNNDNSSYRRINDNSLMKHYYNRMEKSYNTLKTSNHPLPVIENPYMELTDSKDNDNESIFPNNNRQYLSSFRNYIETKSKRIDSNAENYLSYMSREINKSPNQQVYHSRKNKETEGRSSKCGSVDTYYSNSAKDQIKVSSNTNVNLYSDSQSFHLFTPSVIKSYHSDINNPNYYRDDSEKTLFGLLREKEKQILQYNKEVMDNKSRHKRNDINPNPYRNINRSTLGQSNLTNNTILNPVPQLTYNKYLMCF